MIFQFCNVPLKQQYKPLIIWDEILTFILVQFYSLMAHIAIVYITAIRVSSGYKMLT